MAGWARKAQDEGHRSATFTPIQDGRWFAGDLSRTSYSKMARSS